MAKKLLLLLECLLCRNKFTVDAVQQKQYFLETLICAACYKKGQKLPASVWCFGKLAAKNSPGYSEENVECVQICPDKKICKSFVRKLKPTNQQ